MAGVGDPVHSLGEGGLDASSEGAPIRLGALVDQEGLDPSGHAGRQLAGNLGELSLFHQTHGYWVDGVSPTTATLPLEWEQRLVKVGNENTAGAIGWCLDPHDLAFSKLAARREKDLAFVAALVRHKMIRPSVVSGLIAEVADLALRTRLAEAWEICRRRATGTAAAG